MPQLIYQCPLTFPTGWTRTAQGATTVNRQFSKTTTIEDALHYLQDEIAAIHADSAILYTNYESIHNPGMRSKRGNSEGASLQLTVKGASGFLACDQWNTVAHNLYALHLAVRHLRMFEEWGVATADFMLSAFSDKAAQTRAVQSTGMADWMITLGLGPTATLDDANAMYRQRAKQAAADAHALLELNFAIEQARQALGN